MYYFAIYFIFGLVLCLIVGLIAMFWLVRSVL